MLSTSKLISSFIASLLLICFAGSNLASEVDYHNPVRQQANDLVVDLPGLDAKVNFNHYSGYLNADNEEKPHKFLHYWFVESQTNPAESPVLLWLNGGPGCSSLGGFFGELGPFNLENNGTITLRSSAWNKKANVLFLESPTSVGFSYSTKPETLDDNTTAKQNYLAIKSFLRKFSLYQNSSFYISGESYGGVYLPTLGVLLDDDASINFKGVAIGNGYLDAGKLGQTLIFFSYYHGLFGKTLWDQLSEKCCDGKVPGIGACSFKGEGCGSVIETATTSILESGLNPYNYAADCLKPPSTSYRMLKSSRMSHKRFITNTLMRISLNSTLDTPSKYPFTILKAKMLSDDRQEEPPCEDDSALIRYLDREDVQRAIHIPKELKIWAGPCTPINYGAIYPTRKGGLAPQMKKLITSERNLNVLVYNGDLDMMCNFYGDEMFSDDLGFPVVDDFQPWFVNTQVAGYFKNYKNNFSFVTVKGAGHMVPTDKGPETLEMITRWLLEKENK